MNVYNLSSKSKLYFNLTALTIRNLSLTSRVGQVNGKPVGNTNDLRLGFIGTGKIAQAIMLGLIKKQKLKPNQIYASDSNLDYLEYLQFNRPIFKVNLQLII